MKFLSGQQLTEAIESFIEAVSVAKSASCLRANCGSLIVSQNQIIGRGFNSPPENLESQRRCTNDKTSYHPKVTDKTCCIHAEQRAIIDALKNHPDKLPGSRLYFIRLNSSGTPEKAGQPYCTICSKMALDTGIKEFVLWHEQGICVYDTSEYNQLSYQYKSHP